MEYGFVAIAVLMFSVQFLLNDRYQKENGTGIVSSFTLNVVGATVGIISLAIISGFDFSITWFTLICAILSAIIVIGFNLFSLKALEKVNLSVYSLFSMLGGMMLPTIVGIIFYSEGITLAKVICVALIILALTMTVGGQKNKGGTFYYLSVFVLNGAIGVVSKFFSSAPFDKVSSATYSFWIAVVSLVISLTVLFIVRKQFKKPSLKAVLYSAGGGLLNRIGNYLVLLALLVLPASIQSPLTTGGVIIASTLISAIAGQKPTKKEVLSVIISFVGIMALIFIPI